MRVVKKDGIVKRVSNSDKPYYKWDNKQSKLLIEKVWSVENSKRGDKELIILKNEQRKEIEYVNDSLYSQYKTTLPRLEIESALNLALYKAFTSYNPAIGCPFKSYLYNVANKELLMECRNFKRFNGSYATKNGTKRINLSYDSDSKECIDALNLLTSSKHNIDRVSMANECLKLVREFAHTRFKGLVPSIIDLYLEDMMGKDIANKLNTSQAYVTNTRKKFAKKFMEEYPEYRSYLKSL